MSDNQTIEPLIKAGWRYSIRLRRDMIGLAIWVPWRHPSQPLVYCLWGRLYK